MNLNIVFRVICVDVDVTSLCPWNNLISGPSYSTVSLAPFPDVRHLLFNVRLLTFIHIIALN